jgi:hypothetical protein
MLKTCEKGSDRIAKVVDPPVSDPIAWLALNHNVVADASSHNAIQLACGNHRVFLSCMPRPAVCLPRRFSSTRPTWLSPPPHGRTLRIGNRRRCFRTERNKKPTRRKRGSAYVGLLFNESPGDDRVTLYLVIRQLRTDAGILRLRIANDNAGFPLQFVTPKHGSRWKSSCASASNLPVNSWPDITEMTGSSPQKELESVPPGYEFEWSRGLVTHESNSLDPSAGSTENVLPSGLNILVALT